MIKFNLKKMAKKVGKGALHVAEDAVPGGRVVGGAVDAIKKGKEEPRSTQRKREGAETEIDVLRSRANANERSISAMIDEVSGIEARLQALEKAMKVQHKPRLIPPETEVIKQVIERVEALEKVVEEGEKARNASYSEKLAEVYKLFNNVLADTEKKSDKTAQGVVEKIREKGEIQSTSLTEAEARERAVDMISKHEGFSKYPYFDLAYGDNGKTKQIVCIREQAGTPCYYIGKMLAGELVPNFKHEVYPNYEKKGIFHDQMGITWDASKATLTYGFGTVCAEGDSPISREEARGKIVSYLRKHDGKLTATLVSEHLTHLYPPLAEFLYNVGFGTFTREQPWDIWSETAETAVIPKDLPIKQSIPAGDERWSIQKLLQHGHIFGVCNVISWFRMASGEIQQGLINRRNGTIKEIGRACREAARNENEV